MTRNNHGHTLLELIIGAALTLILLGAICTFYLMQNKLFITEERRLPAEHSARSGLNAIVRDMRMAGYRRGTSTIIPLFGTATSVTFRRYTTVAEVTATIDTSYSRRNGHLMRITAAGQTPVTGNIRELGFTFRNITGNITTNWNMVRRIDIRMKTNIPKPEPTFGSYSTYTLTESVMPPNLAE